MIQEDDILLKSFYLGVLALIVVCVVCLITNSWIYIYRISGVIGAVSLAACGIAIGAFQSGGEASFGGDSVSDVMSQTKKSQDSRIEWSTRFLLFGLPNAIAAGIYIYIVFLK